MNDETISKANVRDSITSMLRPDERLIRVARISNGIYWKGIVLFIISLMMMTSVIIFNLGLFMMLVSIIILTHAYLTKHYLLLALTDKRVLVRQGILNLDSIQLRLNRIESVELEWTIPGRILNFSIVVMTGTGSRIAVVPFIADGPQFRKELDEMLLANEDKVERVVVVGQEK